MVYFFYVELFQFFLMRGSSNFVQLSVCSYISLNYFKCFNLNIKKFMDLYFLRFIIDAFNFLS